LSVCLLLCYNISINFFYLYLSLHSFFFHKFKVDLTAFFYGFLLVGWHEKQ
jgi:hypothetical protein